jgi:UDP-N-acetylglucosamine:LPS N-acetylglucosamine transferase
VTVGHGTFEAIGADERIYCAYGPTRRSPLNLIRNLALAVRVLVTVRPASILTTGSGLAVPFVWLGWLSGVKTAYIECSGRVGRSLSGRLVAPVVDRFFVQWPDAEAPGAEFHGSIFFSPR